MTLTLTAADGRTEQRLTPCACICSDGQWRARLEIRRALETFDSSAVDAATLGALVAGGYADLAVRDSATPFHLDVLVLR